MIVILGILIVIALIVIALNVINPGRIQRRSYEAVHMANASKVCTALAACANSSYTPADCNTLQEIGTQTLFSALGTVTPTYTLTIEANSIVMVGSLNATASSKNTTGGGVTVPSRICVISCTYNFDDGVATPPTKNPSVTLAGTTTNYTGCY